MNAQNINTLIFGLGHFVNNNIGATWFDDVTLRLIDTIHISAQKFAITPAGTPWLFLFFC